MKMQEIEKKQNLVRPAGQVMGTAEQVTVRLEMPGVAREGLEIRVENNELFIQGRREKTETGGTWLLRERASGDYYQVYALDETIDPERIDAQLIDGILTITLPVKESQKPRLIKVKTA